MYSFALISILLFIYFNHIPITFSELSVFYGTDNKKLSSFPIIKKLSSSLVSFCHYCVITDTPGILLIILESSALKD